MPRKLRWEIGLLAVLCAVVCWYGATSLYWLDLAAQESAQMALLDEAARKLDEYHKEHGEYPASLASFSFSYPDGGNPSMLANLRYISGGKTYTLKTKGLESALELETGSELEGRVVRR
jgi:hypothetical protein